MSSSFTDHILAFVRAPAGSLVGSFLGPGKVGSLRKEQGSLLLVGTPGQFLEKSVVSVIH